MNAFSLAYVVCGLGTAAALFHFLAGGWDAALTRAGGDGRRAAETLDRLRHGAPVPFGTMTGVLCLVVIALWPAAWAAALLLAYPRRRS